jgi:cytochrome P450
MTTVENDPAAAAEAPPHAQGCPVVRFEELSQVETPALWHFDNMDKLRGRGRLLSGTDFGTEYWVATRAREQRDAYQAPSIFSNHMAGVANPDPEFLWIPEMLDPPLHTRWRQLLGGLFSPGAVAKLEPRVRQRFSEILDEVADRGECDYMQDVALAFPNVIFMELMGLPVEDAQLFQHWETEILHLSPTELDRSVTAMGEVQNYFAELVRDRRKNPRNDIVSVSLTWQIDGQPVSDADLEALYLLLFMAGMDTVAMQLSYSTLHLATHEEDRRRLNEDPSLWPSAIEEFVRYYSFVMPARKVTTDTEFAGVRMKKGQVVWMPLVLANRDPEEFPDADKVVIDRTENRHVGFGLGPHRCLGAHLARQELLIGLTEWHKRIPDYRLAPGADVREHGSGQIGLNNLPIVWDV